MQLDQEYWNNRYLEDNSPWDTGSATSPLQRYIDSLTDKNVRILVPGAGFGHEAIYLFQQGFYNTYICDWSEVALQEIQRRHPDFPSERLICGDFFSIKERFDLILEQTFFCAIDMGLRFAYAKKMYELLNKDGLLVGLLWAEEFDKEGPPFGGTKAEYLETFSPYFHILEMDISPYSIKPRAGKELFFRFLKKENTKG
jgi:thiopurine S-methyltransferase